MNLQPIDTTFAETLLIDSINVMPSNYGEAEVSVYCYFPNLRQLYVYFMSMDVYNRIDVTTFYGYLKTVYHLPITEADIVEVDSENTPVCSF